MAEQLPQTLGDVAEIVMGQSPAGETCNREGIGVPLLNGPTEFGPHHPQATQFTLDPKKHSQVGDILFCVRGSTTGRMNWSDRSYAIGRGIAAIRHLSDPEVQPLVRSIIEYNLPNLLRGATGSTFPNVSARQLAAIPYPPIDEREQLRVASLFGALDEKIDLNRRTSHTLEAIARALFKDWFVDFGPTRAKIDGCEPYLAPDLWALFPDRLDDETGLPEGWRLANVGEAFSLTMGQSPPGNTYNEDADGLPFFQGRTDFGFRYPDNRKFCTAPTRIAQRDDTLVSVRAPVGDINMAWEECCIGRGVAALRHHSGSRSFTYYSAWSIQKDLTQYEHTGTVFGAINKMQFEALRTVEPTRELVAAFEAYIGPLDELIRTNVLENRSLAQSRDLLLPKLMSREIRLRRAEQIVGEAL